MKTSRIRLKHYALRTKRVYVDWIARYIKYFEKRHPRKLTAAHVERYLSYLATELEVAQMMAGVPHLAPNGG